jgi:hypothetical protein
MRRLWNLDKNAAFRLRIAAISDSRMDSGLFLRRVAKVGIASSMEKPPCTCPDYETRGERCKHIYAVEYIVEFRRNSDGLQMTRETLQATETVRPTYPQNWPAYNEAQTHEKTQFQSLLFDLCSGIAEPEQTKGRPRIP